MTLYEKDLAYIWHPFTPFSEVGKVIPLEKAEGVYLHTTDGRKILDAISSWWVNLHGHSHPYIAEKIAEQAKKLEHVIFAGFTHQPAVELAEKLIAILPKNQSKIFYSDNGSTACEVAIKMAFQYWYNQGIEKKRIIAFHGAYHGDTFGAMSVGDRGPFNAPFFPYLFEVDFLELPNCNRLDCQINSVERQNCCVKNEAIISQFEALAKTGEVGAFIYEPLMQGAAGMRMYSPAILERLLKIAKEHQIICIVDEVMTGFGRTGKLFASDYCEIKPDIMCLSKGLTGGTMALGVTSCTDEIMEAFKSNDLMKTFFHGHSFTANPLACTAGVASMELLLAEKCQENLKRIEQKQAEFAEKMSQHPKIREVRHLGTITALEIDTEQETGYVNEARSSLYQYFIERDLLLRPLGNVLYVLPPYIISNEELDMIYEEIEKMLEDSQS